MSEESFRFLHASDLHLEQPAYGLTEIPDHLREVLADAPLEAASRVFETAILENVEFVVLAGDIINPRTGGPRAISFLLEQFDLLREQRIHVYWCGGREDSPDRWPDDLPLPETVHLFPKGQIKQLAHAHNGVPVATVIGTSSSGNGAVHAGEFRIEPTSRFTVAVAYGQADASSLAGHKQIDYWALGGRHQQKTLFQSPQMAHFSGSPQGRCPEETGIHGCTLVQVDPGRKARTKFIPTDVVRWCAESVSLDENAQRNDLQRELRSRMQKITSEASGSNVMVRWRVQADGALAGMLRSGGLDRELLEWLRTEFGRTRPAVWAVSLDVESGTTLPDELYEEDTILGDFLRAVRQHEQDHTLALDFARFLPDMGKNRSLASAIESDEAGSRAALLHEAAVLGADLLTGEELT
jgi:DNA repair exonuclease SbcCD nuclease subunit